ncbi:hypothetical protein H6G36_24730 [Anabaena minutissima FACHB-250]|nr:hypothetical protein [Anabaena minutissima FACHB-250]
MFSRINDDERSLKERFIKVALGKAIAPPTHSLIVKKLGVKFEKKLYSQLTFSELYEKNLGIL